MKKYLGSIISIMVVGGISGCGDSPTSQLQTVAKHNLPAACDTSTEITGKEYNILGTGINVRNGPGAEFDKVINQKATDIMKTTYYISVDESTTVFEECFNGDWSWIRVTEPNSLSDSHRGWVESASLDKGQDIGGDKYARKISSSAFSPYTRADYPDTFSKYGSRINEIEGLRRKAAELAVDSGKCDFVLMSELSIDENSTVNNPKFWVDCRNMQRIYITESQIKEGAPILTQEEKSWDEESAISACQAEIKNRALIPSSTDIHSFLGTSFYKAPTTQNFVLRMDFDARNALGADMPYTAICHFEPGEIGSIEIQPR